MNFKEKIAKAVTPQDTEEVKPGLFVQTKFVRKAGSGEKVPKSYRTVYPSAWDGKINWNNFIFGGSVLKTIIPFLVVLFIVFAYVNDVREYKNFYETVRGDPIAYCMELERMLTTPECTPDLEALGLCKDYKKANEINLTSSNFSEINIYKNEKRDEDNEGQTIGEHTDTISDYDGEIESGVISWESQGESSENNSL